LSNRTFAFIFARGGSKGLPGKNIKILNGLPLIAHAIKLAKAVGHVERIYVSTDDTEIGEVAKTYGAEIIKRPDNLASDTAPEWLAWQHAVNYVRDIGLDFDTFLSLPTTSPLRDLQDVIACLQTLDSTTDVVITTTPAARSPYFNMISLDEEGFAHILLDQSSIKRRQDAPIVYDVTTVAYATRPDYILNHNSLFEGRVRAVVVPKERAVDIDDDIDFKIAKALSVS
jgi:N-acylneuraminate cytidylyltransferase